MSENNICLEITGREAKLVLKYGYPFPEQKEIFEAIAGKKGWHTINVEKYWLELIIGDLCRSIKEVKSYSLQNELDSLCSTLEMAVNSILIKVTE